MAVPSDLTDEEVAWLARLHHALGLGIPRETEAKLLRLGLVHLAEIGLKVSRQGELLLQAHPRRRHDRHMATRLWTKDLTARAKYEHERAEKLKNEARSLRQSPQAGE